MTPASFSTRVHAGSFSYRQILDLLSKWGPFILISIAFIAMFGWTWGRWVDVAEDLGRELYVPWQLAQGKVLYRDIAYFNGPLSPYFNALWFRVFGPGFWILVSANVGVILAITALVFYTGKSLGNRFAATLASLVFLCAFAFSVIKPHGNFSYAAPYSHEMTHGILLCFGLMACFCRYHQTGRTRFVLGMGLCTGLLLLTKVEMCLAGITTGLAGLALVLMVRRWDAQKCSRLAGMFGLGLIVPPVAAFFFLSLAMPVSQALKGVFSPFMAFTYNGISSMPFYQIVMGLDTPGYNLMVMGRMFLGYLVVLGIMGLGAILWGRKIGLTGKIGMALAVLPPILVFAMYRRIGWAWIGRPYGLLCLGLLVWLAWGMWKNRQNFATMDVAAGRILFLILALSLLPKMFLNQRIFLYGFGLGMPATMVLIVAVTAWIPQAIKRNGGAGLAFCGGAACLVLMATVPYLEAVNMHLQSKVYAVGQGVDQMYWSTRALAFNKFLEYMQKTIPQEKTLSAMPGCAMFNYLSRRPNPSGYITCIPPEMTMFGQENILNGYKNAPPDYIILVHRDDRQYGARFFGQDYGLDLFAWVAANYDELVVMEPRPFQGNVGGYLLMKRKGPDKATLSESREP